MRSDEICPECGSTVTRDRRPGKIIQMINVGGYLYTLDEKGKVWVRSGKSSRDSQDRLPENLNGRWYRLED